MYRARDTKLDRDVAIKILPEAFAHDPERVARFEREAKTLADRIAQGPISLAEALAIARQMPRRWRRRTSTASSTAT